METQVSSTLDCTCLRYCVLKASLLILKVLLRAKQEFQYIIFCQIAIDRFQSFPEQPA